MKRLTLFMFTCMAWNAHAQSGKPDLSWTFQRAGTQLGLLFEAAGLSPAVRCAIRDDVEQTYRANPGATAVFRAYSPGDEKHGVYAGRVWLENPVTCPDGLRSLDYRVYGGVNYLAVPASLCANYAVQITLTNQHAVAVGSLSSFLHTANHLSVTNTTAAAFAQMWWRFKEGRAGAEGDDTPQSFTEGIQSMSAEQHYHPSLLLFWERVPTHWDAPSDGQSVFGCTIRSVPKTGGNGFDGVDMDAVYKDGEWRFVAWE